MKQKDNEQALFNKITPNFTQSAEKIKKPLEKSKISADIALKPSKTYAKCNVCGREFEIKLREIETKETIERYFNCTWCRQKYHVYTEHKKRIRRKKKGN